MIFSISPYYISIERMMTSVPNFQQRAHGRYVLEKHEYTAENCDCRYCPHYDRKKKCKLQKCVCIEERIEAGAASRRELLTETMSAINNPAFLLRLQKYINESEESPMKYKNELHGKLFDLAIGNQNQKDNRLMSALYLLTADGRLWNRVKRNIKGNSICFNDMKLSNSSENAYTFFCAAKDLYLGTKHLCISDLTDSTIISAVQFGIICNAMAIRRYGVNALQIIEEGGERK